MRRRIKGILMSGKQFSLDSRLDLFHGIETSLRNRNSSIPMGNLPAVEDTTEYEDKSSSPSGNSVQKFFENFTRKVGIMREFSCMESLGQEDINFSVNCIKSD